MINVIVCGAFIRSEEAQANRGAQGDSRRHMYGFLIFSIGTKSIFVDFLKVFATTVLCQGSVTIVTVATLITYKVGLERHPLFTANFTRKPLDLRVTTQMLSRRVVLL